ncbi:hypothetical protein H2200_012297 [Cladophialophora chaetospira]|uniref:PBP domain-containing protein n=1 Tax=Cladophialophora chaetospira TaxID=386627 RepID=A0AA38WXP3_9EURO|nr:hypothetical protein H2200_012297 [Cladophialophora chaetospira]
MVSGKITAIVTHGPVDREAKEKYGIGPVLLRIGNGGAGATGLLKALAEDFLAGLTHKASIEWVCNHSRNTQLALLQGYIDIALTYERDQEDLAAAEGWSTTVGCAFHDHFCLAGPWSDPADVRCAASLQDAFLRIAHTGSLFHSRADSSATMWKERGIWTDCGLEPWSETATGQWYRKSLYSPAEALAAADAADAYLLIDRATLLTQTIQKTVRNTTVFFEPTSPSDVLMNSCYALTLTSQPAERSRATSEFLEYLLSDAGQAVVENFGKAETGGFPHFAPAQNGFATSHLKGGLPRDGRWIIQTPPKL